MKKYEFFCVVSQDLTEQEVNGLVDNLKTTIGEVGGINLVEQLLGRQRLAYPFQGKQSYGTFVLLTFDIDPTSVVLFREKIKFFKGIVRSVIRVFDVASVSKKVKKDTTVQFATAPVESVVKEVRNVEPEIAMHEVAEPVIVAQKDAVVAEKVVMTQEELDKRIDALLNDDINPDTL